MPRVVIVGAGVGGLCAALALMKQGFRVTVFEQAPVLREIGAGIQISANGLLVLDELGLGNEVLARASCPSLLEVRMWKTGEKIVAFKFSSAAQQNKDYSYATIYRPDLISILSDAIRERDNRAIRLGCRVTHIEEEHGTVHGILSNGDRFDCDVLIGSDGIHSTIRASLHGQDKRMRTCTQTLADGAAKYTTSSTRSLSRSFGRSGCGSLSHNGARGA